MTSLQINSLFAQVGSQDILKGVSLQVKPGEIHAIMGPNGSGKSTLAHILAGHPSYTATAGSVLLKGKNVLEMSPDERAQHGLFLAFQYPVEIPGVRVQAFLRQAFKARFGEEVAAQRFPTALAFKKHVEALAEELRVKKTLLTRGLNEGFSGGEKKRLEILQMAVLEPEFAILDETDSGLDIDAIQAVAEGVNTIVKKHKTGVIVITHYQRILNYLKPNVVHVMVDGTIIETGGEEVIERIEKQGYKNL